MTPGAAIAAILAEFPRDDLSEVAETIAMTSGGLRTERDVEPALYASRDLAVAAFQREALTALRERAPAAITFVDGPHVDKWNVTVMDSRGTHRVAEQRWSVTAKIGLIQPGGSKMSSLSTLEAKIDKLQETLDRMASPAPKPVEAPAPAAPQVAAAPAPLADPVAQATAEPAVDASAAEPAPQA